MEIVEVATCIVVFVIGIFCGSILAIWLSFDARKRVMKLADEQATKQAVSKPKSVLVPGRGFFTVPKAKKTPKYWREDELWAKEQDEKRS